MATRVLLHHCSLDLERRLIVRGKKRISLTAREVEVLACLLRTRGEVVRREHLERSVWNMSPSVKSEAVSIAMRRLRLKLERDPRTPENLFTVRGVGWRLAPAPKPPPGGLLGRDAELAVLQARLRTDPLLVIQGPGGVGKTTLARAILDTQDGFFVDLSHATDLDAFLLRVAGVLGVPLQGANLPAARQARIEAHLRQGGLLVLDNLEQLAGRVEPALESWAKVTSILCTSRFPMHSAHAGHMVLGPLSVPDAAALFVRRAKQVLPSVAFSGAEQDHIRELVGRLDGLPLAVELVAGRAGVFSPEQMLQRLDRPLALMDLGRSPNQRTMRATVAWSWSLLSEAEQDVLRGCALFRGPFLVEAAEAVLEAGDAPIWSVLDSLQAKGLLRSGQRPGHRLVIWPVVRDFLAEECPPSEAATRHYLRFYRRTAEERWRAMWHDGFSVKQALHSERSDLLHARQLALQRGEHEAIAWIGIALEMVHRDVATDLRLSVLEGADPAALSPALAARYLALRGFARQSQGHIAEGFAEMQRAVTAAAGENDPHTLSFVYTKLTLHHTRHSPPDTALRWCQKTLQQAREACGSFEQAMALNNLGSQLVGLGRLDEARPMLREACARFSVLGYQSRLFWALLSRAELELRCRRLDTVRELLAEAEVPMEAGGTGLVRGAWMLHCAILAIELGQDAEALLREGRALSAALHLVTLNADIRLHHARWLLDRADPAAAAALIDAVIADLQRQGRDDLLFGAQSLQVAIAAALAGPAAALSRLERLRQRTQFPADRAVVVRCLLEWVALYALAGQPQDARSLFAEIDPSRPAVQLAENHELYRLVGALLRHERGVHSDMAPESAVIRRVLRLVRREAGGA